MSHEVLLVAGVGVIATSLAVKRVAGRIIEQHRVRGTINRARPVSTEQIEGTVARVSGVTKACGGELIAPLSGRSCLLYRSRATGSFWTTKAGGARYESFAMQPFAVDGGPGQVVIVTGEYAWL